MRLGYASAFAAAAAFSLAFGVSERAAAMPPFAQAYGVKCSVCHTQVPALNTYGRYVQRTGYASLDPHVLKRALPVWVGEAATYDSLSGSYKTQFGNLEIHAVGAIGSDVTYHFQQWIQDGNQAGNLDTFWVTYNNLLHRDGHAFVGLVEAPGPSPFSMWMDLATFTTPEIVVGEHGYELDANRWGAKFNYVKSNIDAEVAYLGSGDGWNGASEWGNTDKTFQYKLAYANPQQPAEWGAFGSRGSYPLAEGGTDQYWSFAPYVQRDPNKGVPGILVMYQMALDGNPGFTTLPSGALQPLGRTASTATTFELYQPIMDKGLISIRKEFTNDGLGNQIQTGNIDFNYQIARYLHIYVENYYAQHSIPGWRYMLWWTTPLTSVK